MIFLYVFLIVLVLGMLFVICEAASEGEFNEGIHERLRHRFDKHRPNKKGE